MNKAYLLMGGNLGDRRANLALARKQLAKNCGTIFAESSLYETAAWGREDQPAFLNQAIGLQTDLAADELLDHILRIEAGIGRVRGERYGPRQIDIDILLFNEEVHQSLSLTIPHPELPNRRFALTPLTEIAGDLVHPVKGIAIRELLNNCIDPLPVKKI